MDIQDLSWEEVLEISFKNYLKFGARSSKKLIPPHFWIREKLKQYFDESYEFYSFGLGNSKFDKEYSVEGVAYNKKSDVSIIKNGEVVGVVSFKFVSSNYNQNSNNYFENLLGECFNIQAKNIPFCHILVMRDKIPYYESNGNFKKCEKLKNHHLKKYVNILNLDENYAIPNKLCINIIKISVENNDIKILSPKKFAKMNEKNDEDKKDLEKILESLSIKIIDSFEDCSDEVSKELKNMDINQTLKDFSSIVKSRCD